MSNSQKKTWPKERRPSEAASSYRQGLQTGSSYQGSAFGASMSGMETQLSSAQGYDASYPTVSESKPTPKVHEHYYQRSVPFGRYHSLQVVNEPDRVRSNIGLTQRSFERFDNAPVMRVPAYGFSGEDYTQLARQSVPGANEEFLQKEIKKARLQLKPEPIFSQAKLELPRITYGRGPVFAHSAPALRAARAAKLRHEHNQAHATSFNARMPNYINAREAGYRNSAELNEEVVPFYSGVKNIAMTTCKIQAHNLDVAVSQHLLNSLVEQEQRQKSYLSPHSPHVTLAASDATNITYALPPKGHEDEQELVVSKLDAVAQTETLNAMAQQQEDLEESCKLKQQASELKAAIMNEGHTVLIGELTCAHHDTEPQKSVLVVKSPEHAFVTSSEVKVLMRDYKARALHGTNSEQLAATKMRLHNQQVTLPPEYFYEAQQVPKSAVLQIGSASTLLGSEATRITFSSQSASELCHKVFNLPQEAIISDLEEETKESLEQDNALDKITDEVAKVDQAASDKEEVVLAKEESDSTPKRRVRSRRKRS